MKSLEHLIYDMLINQRMQEDIGVIGSDKPVGMPAGGFSPSFSSRHPNSTINRKRNAAQQKNAAPIASFESGGGKRNNINPVPNQGDAPSVGDLSARGASEGGKKIYKSIRTKLKEMQEILIVEQDENNTTTIKKKKPDDDNPVNPPQQPSTVDAIKNTFHDAMVTEWLM